MRTQPYLARFPNRCERQRFQEKLNCDFYINVLMGSPYSSQIKGLANLVEGKISERGLKIKFDKKLFFAAAGMCIYGHRNQIRKSGRLYAEHPILVVERLIELLHVCDPNELIAGFLHDLVEDTQHDYRSSKNITVGDIEAIFGRDAARIVDGLTKLKQLGKNKWIDERNINKFVKALQQDVRVLRIKMVDRGCNLEDSEFTSRESRHRNATEALDLYVPLGVLAGFMKVARNLADVALKVLNLERYQEIQNYIARVASSSFSYEIARMKEAIEKRALKKNLDGPITVLSKSRTAYELAQIAELRGEDSWQPHDVLMIQVITQSEADCYRMLGVIQDLGEHPADKYWRDYIHDPKVNGYQSLHTAVWVNGILVRFQIRSREMQYIAQEGVLYKPYKKEGEFKQPDLPWLSQNWIRMILRVADRREKILLIKAMSGARKASVIIVSPDCSLKQLEVLLPQNISPLEALMIVDPASALKVVRASLPGVSNIAGVSLDLTTPVPGGMGHIDFRLGNKIQSRNYARLLNDPMARFSYRKFLEQSDKQFQIEVGKMILEPHLERQWLGFSDLAHFAGDEFHDLLSRLAQAKLSVAFVMDWLRSHIFGDDSEVVALKRITFDMMLGTEPRLLSKLNSLFPTDCFAVQKSQVQFALSLTNAVQERQLARLLAMLSPHIEKIETLVPPIIDDKCLRPDGIYYAHRVAEKARQAIQAQEGFVYGFSLKPGANFDQRYAEVIRTARILFFSGGKEQLTGFREELMSFVPREFNEDFPIIVLMNGRHSGLDVSNIVGSLMDGSQVSSEEYFSGFFLEHLRQRAAVIR